MRRAADAAAWPGSGAAGSGTDDRGKTPAQAVPVRPAFRQEAEQTAMGMAGAAARLETERIIRQKIVSADHPAQNHAEYPQEKADC